MWSRKSFFLYLSLLFILLCVSKLDNNWRGAPLHGDAVVCSFDRNHRNLEKYLFNFSVFLEIRYNTDLLRV